MHRSFEWLFLHTRNALSSSDREEFVAQQTDPSTGEVQYSLARIAHWPEAAVPLLVDQLRGWCAAKTDARVLLGSLAMIDPRLGVWCAATVVERRMNRRTASIDPARAALDVARDWALGRATPEQCQRAADAARAFANARDDAAEAWAEIAANEAEAYGAPTASYAREDSRRASLAAVELANAAAAVASAAANPSVNAAHMAMVATRVAAAEAHKNNVAATEDLRAQCEMVTEAVSRAIEALARGA